jgi:hypothetical protein
MKKTIKTKRGKSKEERGRQKWLAECRKINARINRK